MCRYASHLGLPAIMVRLHGRDHTNLARWESRDTAELSLDIMSGQCLPPWLCD